MPGNVVPAGAALDLPFNVPLAIGIGQVSLEGVTSDH